MQSVLVAFFISDIEKKQIKMMDELPFSKGDFVRIDGINAVVVANEEDENIPVGYLAVFFGSEVAKRESEGGEGNSNPIVWIVPIDLCEDGLEPKFKE